MKNRIIALTGSMFSGKSTVQALLKSKLENNGYKVFTIKFAQPLYDMQEFIYDRINEKIPYPKDRKLLQWLGTEWGRSINKDLWVNLWYKDAQDVLSIFNNAIVLCDDVRFNNEAEAVKRLNGAIISIEASDAARARRGVLVNSNHTSEKGIDKEYITANIYNEGSLIDLDQQVSYLLDNLGV